MQEATAETVIYDRLKGAIQSVSDEYGLRIVEIKVVGWLDLSGMGNPKHQVQGLVVTFCGD